MFDNSIIDNIEIYEQATAENRLTNYLFVQTEAIIMKIV